MKLQQIWSDSRAKVATLLLLLLLLAIKSTGRIDYLGHAAVAVVSAVVFDFLLTYIRFRVKSFPLSALVTGLLIAMVASPVGGMGASATAGLLAILSKHFILPVENKHIFNPAAFGIISASLIFNAPVAWWGVSWGILPAIIIALWMTPILLRLHRFWHPVLFLLVYAATILWIGGNWRLIIDGTVFLFAFVMLPEPMTSLARGFWQYGWGIMAGIFVAIFVILKINTGDPLLLSLLLANLLGFVLVRRKI